MILISYANCGEREKLRQKLLSYLTEVIFSSLTLSFEQETKASGETAYSGFEGMPNANGSQNIAITNLNSYF